MRNQSAAPGVSRTPGSGNRGGNAASIADPGLPSHVIALLQAEGVRTLEDWRALGRSRFMIFGITRAMVCKIDALALEREAPR